MHTLLNVPTLLHTPPTCGGLLVVVTWTGRIQDLPSDPAPEPDTTGDMGGGDMGGGDMGGGDMGGGDMGGADSGGGGDRKLSESGADWAHLHVQCRACCCTMQIQMQVDGQLFS